MWFLNFDKCLQLQNDDVAVEMHSIRYEYGNEMSVNETMIMNI